MKRAWLVIELLFAFTAVLLGLIACSYMFPKRVDHDIWDIATAIGTVGAAVAAVWIATNEERRRQKAEKEIARLTAASMVWRLTNDAAQIELTLEWLEEGLKVDPSPHEFISYGKALESTANWTLHDLLPLASMPQNCAARLATAADQVRISSVILKAADQGTNGIARLHRINIAMQAQKILITTKQSLGETMRHFREVAKEMELD